MDIKIKKYHTLLYELSLYNKLSEFAFLIIAFRPSITSTAFGIIKLAGKRNPYRPTK